MTPAERYEKWMEGIREYDRIRVDIRDATSLFKLNAYSTAGDVTDIPNYGQMSPANQRLCQEWCDGVIKFANFMEDFAEMFLIAYQLAGAKEGTAKIGGRNPRRIYLPELLQIVLDFGHLRDTIKVQLLELEQQFKHAIALAQQGAPIPEPVEIRALRSFVYGKISATMDKKVMVGAGCAVVGMVGGVIVGAVAKQGLKMVAQRAGMGIAVGGVIGLVIGALWTLADVYNGYQEYQEAKTASEEAKRQWEARQPKTFDQLVRCLKNDRLRNLVDKDRDEKLADAEQETLRAMIIEMIREADTMFVQAIA